MNKVLFVSLLAVSLTGCSSASEETTADTETKTETSETGYEENVTGGTEVEALETNAMMITDTDNDMILDPNKDETVQSIEESGFEYTLKMYDTDGNGKINTDEPEMYTTNINLKSTSGNDIEVNDLQFYLQSADDDLPIEITYILTPVGVDENKFVFDEPMNDFLVYRDEETNDTFTFPKDGEITLVITQTASGSSTIEPAELSFTAFNDEEVGYYIESTTEFAAE